MEPFDETASTREVLKAKLRENFDGRIVRKDLTKKIKEGANVPVYVLEFLLGQYCSSDDEEVIEKGVQQVKRILADNFVRPDEAQKILSLLRSRGSYTIIDKITVQLNIKKNCYEAEFSNLGLKEIPIEDEYPEKYDRRWHLVHRSTFLRERRTLRCSGRPWISIQQNENAQFFAHTDYEAHAHSNAACRY